MLLKNDGVSGLAEEFRNRVLISLLVDNYSHAWWIETYAGHELENGRLGKLEETNDLF
jgi:hypothetical protein